VGDRATPLRPVVLLAVARLARPHLEALRPVTAEVVAGVSDRLADGRPPPARADRPEADRPEHVNRKIGIRQPQADGLDGETVGHARDLAYDTLVAHLRCALDEADIVIAHTTWPPNPRSRYVEKLLVEREELAGLILQWKQMREGATSDDIAKEPPTG
jgi:hypothetical protein